MFWVSPFGSLECRLKLYNIIINYVELFRYRMSSTKCRPLQWIMERDFKYESFICWYFMNVRALISYLWIIERTKFNAQPDGIYIMIRNAHVYVFKLAAIV